ncbi:probable acyl carrier protein Cj1299-related protein [Clostridium sp. CAG:715]|jgi:probable acyl carrier protein cj1299-related protein|nr:probable acyl carrier protein Cj1299-related protein [Clostridium sp. CAG:715]
MNKNEVSEKLANILSTVFEKTISVRDNFSMESSDDWTSLKHIELIVMLEEEFEISFEPEIISELTSQQKLFEYIERQLG